MIIEADQYNVGQPVPVGPFHFGHVPDQSDQRHRRRLARPVDELLAGQALALDQQRGPVVLRNPRRGLLAAGLGRGFLGRHGLDDSLKVINRGELDGDLALVDAKVDLDPSLEAVG